MSTKYILFSVMFVCMMVSASAFSGLVIGWGSKKIAQTVVDLYRENGEKSSQEVIGEEENLYEFKKMGSVQKLGASLQMYKLLFFLIFDIVKSLYYLTILYLIIYVVFGFIPKMFIKIRDYIAESIVERRYQ